MNDNLLHKLTNYQLPSGAIDLIRRTRVVFLVGITGAGKDTILSRLLAMPDYHPIISHTTRPPRSNNGVMEQNGVDYHFIDLVTAEAMLDNGGYIEAKRVHNNVYGTSVAEIQMAHDEAKIAISDIEVQGIAEYRAVADNVIPIFLLPPDFTTWQSRIAGRYDGQVDEVDLRVRMQTAVDELQEVLEKDYYQFVINKDIDLTVQITNEIAHGSLSDEKNDQAREVARQLLDDIKTALA